MSSPGPNLPVVIQQAGDVSRIQENMQRVGEQQQAAASEDAANEANREQHTVQPQEPSDAENRVRADAHQRERRRQGRKGKKKKKPPEEEAAPKRPRDDDSLLDVVV